MDRVEFYRQTIQNLLERRRAFYLRGKPCGYDVCCIFDQQRDHYLLLDIGWQNTYRVRRTSLYLRIVEGKIWIEEDSTDDSIAEELIAEGISQDEIVLAFHSPALRPLTDFAIA